MGKTEKIRGAITAAECLTQPQIVERSGVPTNIVGTFLWGAVQRGEVLRSGEKGSYLYSLAPHYTPSRAAPKQRKKRVPKADREKIRDITKKAHAPAADSALHALTMDSVLITARHLVTTVRAEVEFEDNALLTHAIESFERAEKIHAAAAAR